MQRALSAPGKVFISGEYAVLWGGTARIAAVGPRASALVRLRSDTQVHLLLEEGRLSGVATPLGARWASEPPPGFAFAARAVDLALRCAHRQTTGFDLALSPSRSSEDGQKLGMGGSARAVVLATEAARFALEEKWDPLKLALLAHHESQGNRGSGGDVAAVYAGGVIRYRQYDVGPLVRAALGERLSASLLGAAPVDVLRLPAPKVSLAYVFVGPAASTRELIRLVDTRLPDSEKAKFVNTSDGIGNSLENALTRGDMVTVRSAFTELHQLLLTLGPLENEAMRRAMAVASAYGAAAKLSGAGGGDGCLLATADAASRAQLIAGLSERGFWAIPLELEPGLRGEVTPDPLLESWIG